MSRALSPRHLTILMIVLSGLVPLFAGCGGGGSSGSAADADLLVVYFSHDNRTDVFRDDLLEIRFSAPVTQVTERTVRVLYGQNQQTPMPGALIVDGNKIFFDPTISQQAWDLGGQAAPRDLPFGFYALTNYQLYIPSLPNLKTVTNLDGSPIIKEYFSSFTTTESYRPEAKPEQPRFIGVIDPDSGEPTGQLGFLPASYRDNDPSSPTYDEVVVAYNAEIVLQFDEVLDPSTLIPSDTVVVQNITPPGGGSPIPVPGTLRHSKDGTRYFFEPSFHYGTGPFTIRVTVNQGITDLTGNKLKNPVTLEFKTEYKANVNTIAFVDEDFSDNNYEDLDVTTARWNDIEDKGELLGGLITTTPVTVYYTGDGILTFRTRTPYPLVSELQQTNPTTGGIICSGWAQGIRWQTSYSVADLGSDGSITELAWGPDSNALFAATYPNIQIRIGHLDNVTGVLGTVFADNFVDGVPVPQYDGQYGVPQRANIDPPGLDTGYWPYPRLSSPFDYNGETAIVVDMQVSPAGTCQTHRCWFNGAAAGSFRRFAVATDRNADKDNFTIAGGGSPQVVYDARITKRRRKTMAQSLWYEARSDSPNYADPIVSPPFQGANGMPDPNDLTQMIPNPISETPWNTNINSVDLKRFVRFRLTLYANLNSDTVPRFTSIQLPYEY
jgi:Big-like domain-containing protein